MTTTSNSIDTRIREAIRQLRNLPGDLESEDDPSFTSEQVNFLEKRLYEIRALLAGDAPSQLYADNDLSVHDLLAKHRMIGVVWCIDDVQEMRPDLTADQAWEVLQEVERKHHAEVGISWTTLEIVADDLFPEPDHA